MPKANEMIKVYEFCLLGEMYEKKQVIDLVNKAVKLTKNGYDVRITKE